ncbi:MAG: FAD-dependent oxidoreductase [Oscillospiraceae bacterium]|nr:FAD-dependent oxidoreductase [Oscillospiraceae bacterium]
MYDVIVVGGGVAGMTAALYALRNGKSALVIEKHGFGGQITYTPKVENYPGTLQMSGNEFADNFLEQILAQGAEVELETVTAVEDRGDTKLVRTEEGGEYEGGAVILATGVKHRMLGLPGENELVGEGISFCAVCDGDFYADRTVCVAGGGNSALQEAILLTGKCKKVIMLQDLPVFTGEKTLQDVLFSRENVEAHTNIRITGLRQDGGALTGVQTLDTATGEEKTFDCDGLFLAIGLIPENGAFAELAKLDERGYFDSGEDCETKTPGVFVAGDCRRKTLRQVTTAAGDGAVAAIAACRYLDAR